MAKFSYDAAFERNLGWLTEAEQLALRGKRVAIAGMGGVGGVHMITLTRLGIGAFNIADFDEFSIANFNRQIGANVETIDRPKAQVLQEMALAVNPELRIKRFDEGVNEANLEDFLAGVDLFVDGFDFFVLGVRRRVFARCYELGIPALTAGPIGMGTGFLAFVPGGMTFEDYFAMEGKPELEQYLRFLVGLVPKMLHRPYLVDPTRLNLATKTGPSIGAACQLCSGVATITAAKLLLRRGTVKAAPWSQHYDVFRDKLATTRLPWGLNGPIWRLKLKLLGPRIIAQMLKQAPPPDTFTPADAIDEILHAARWTPSGDNEQPWRFQRVGPDAIRVFVAPPDTQNIYHYRDGEPTLLAAGMLLESLRIAASAHGRRSDWQIEATKPLQLLVRFEPDPEHLPDPLFAALGERSVDRHRYRTRKLTPPERSALEAALGGVFRIGWLETPSARWQFARLSALATRIRLAAPETFPIHQRIIDWARTLSPTRIPARALGLRASTVKMMHWAMQDWVRMQRLNRLGGKASSTLEMDYLPIMFSAAAFTLRLASPDPGPRSTESLLEAGIHLQRFWLTAARLGLAMQPALAVLAFAYYGQLDPGFTADAAVQAQAKHLAQEFRRVLGSDPDAYVFMGRIGEPHRRMNVSRSVRRPIAELMLPPATENESVLRSSPPENIPAPPA